MVNLMMSMIHKELEKATDVATRVQLIEHPEWILDGIFTLADVCYQT